MSLNQTIEANIGKLRQKPIVFFALIIVFVGLTFGVFYLVTGSLPGLPQPEVVATVNGEKILKKDYDLALKAYEYFYTEVYPKEIGQKISTEISKSLGQNVLDNMIMVELLTQYLQKKGIQITDEEIREDIKKQIVDPSYKGDWGAYEKYLSNNRSSLDLEMKNFKRQLLVQKVIKLEKIEAYNFDKWYADLKAKADIKESLNQ